MQLNQQCPADEWPQAHNNSAQRNTQKQPREKNASCLLSPKFYDNVGCEYRVVLEKLVIQFSSYSCLLHARNWQ
jgi:hypothetical protein